ncbi:MAG: hypothetical protein HOI95_24345 [Chromatiales bacterium]|jgi:hypothetical protein|nr:hypothetical protein [Chromatiales bacterium]
MDYILYFVLVSTWNTPLTNAAGHVVPDGGTMTHVNERTVSFGRANEALCKMAGGFLADMKVELDGKPAKVKDFQCKYVGDVASS